MNRNRKEALDEVFKKVYLSDPLSEKEFESALDLLAQYLLFETKWEVDIVKNPKKRKVPILDDIPLICKANECLYADKCPVLKSIPKNSDRLKLVGTECRADRIYALEAFADFIKELQIDVDNTTDIINVASLVRNLILKRRIDWTLAIEGIMHKEPGVIDQRTGQVYWKAVVHPLLKVSEALEKQIAVLQKQLMADRQARASFAASLGKGNDILKELFSNTNLLEQSNPIDAEFYLDTEEREE